MKENRGAVLSAEIGVKRHLHDLGMAGFIRTNILISRVFRVAAAVAHSRIHHSGHALERGLDPPRNILHQTLHSRSSTSPLCFPRLPQNF